MDKINEHMKIKRKSWYFFRMQHLIYEDKNLDSYDKLIYGVISRYADIETGDCYPSINTIAKKASCSKKRTIKSIKNLVQAGYIEKNERRNKNGGNKSNLYKVKDLAYISDLKKYAKRNNKTQFLNKINKRLKNHPIPTEEELMDLHVKIENKQQDKEMQELYDKGYK